MVERGSHSPLIASGVDTTNRRETVQTGSARWLRFLLVLIPYLILIGGTAFSYADAEGDLRNDLPKVLLWVPAIFSLLIPVTYGILLFGVKENRKPTQTLLLGGFMAVTMLILTFVVYLAANASPE